MVMHSERYGLEVITARSRARRARPRCTASASRTPRPPPRWRGAAAGAAATPAPPPCIVHWWAPIQSVQSDTALYTSSELHWWVSITRCTGWCGNDVNVYGSRLERLCVRRRRGRARASRTSAPGTASSTSCRSLCNGAVQLTRGLRASPPAPGHNHKLDRLQNPAAWPAAAAVGLERAVEVVVDAGAAAGVGRPTMAETMLLNGENSPQAP